ncbi:maleylpyruvate isomerase family mycothiol-dependent enzyme [Streptosporangium sp. KLBMP 9127]|nr:maleylpyruvate isomerase family mycothiol-dependent enzyme [Streptosporangium sp. KLBMP 9127]
MRQWTHAEYTEAVEREITRMADAVAGQDMSVPVPTCPGWDIGALIAHVGGVHRWSAAMVRDLSDKRYDLAKMDHGLPEDRAAYPEWLAEGAGILRAALSAHDPDAPMWAITDVGRVGFWARRQLQETVVHRADAEIALGVAPMIDEAVAADGVDEYLSLLPHARWRKRVLELTGDGETISWQADSGAGWLITLHADGFDHEPSLQPGTVTVRAATSGDLQLLAWGRRDAGDYAVEGDEAFLAWWLERAAI